MYLCQNSFWLLLDGLYIFILMKNLYLFLMVFGLFALGYAQVDNKGKFAPLKLDNPNTSSSQNFSSGSSSIQFKSMFDKDDSYLKKYSILNKKEEETKNLMTPEAYKNPGDIVRDKLNDKDKPIKEEYKTDVYFGEFKVDTKYVKIICYDHEYPDGDLVMILQNDFVVVPQIVLEANSKEYYVSMVEGFNKVEFVALNQGESGPNTAAFSVFDDQGRLIVSNKWNLLTGNKAKLVFVKGRK